MAGFARPCPLRLLRPLVVTTLAPGGYLLPPCLPSPPQERTQFPKGKLVSAPFGIHSCTFIYPAIAKNFCINLGGFLLSLLNFWGRDFEERYTQ